MALRSIILNAPEHGVPCFTIEHAREWVGRTFPMEDATGRRTGEGQVRDARLMDEFGQRATLTVWVPDHLSGNFESNAGRATKLPFER